MQTTTLSRIFGLDFIRATAIVFVLFSHIYYLIGSANPTLISFSGLFGFAGVELFFVLSGYLIGTILLRDFLDTNYSLSSFFTFIKRRWFRTLPNYYLILLVNIGITLYLGYPIKNLELYFIFLQNFNTYSITFFTESWSLSVEEWTYILFPITLLVAFFFTKIPKKHLFIFTILSLIIIAHILRYIAFQEYSITSMEIWNVTIKSVVIYRYDTILWGGILAWIHWYYPHFLYQYKTYALIVAVHLFLLQFIILNVLGISINTNGIYFIVFYFTLSSLIFFLALPYFIFWKQNKTKISSIVTFVSKTSYAAYLVHYSIVSVVLKNILYSYNLKLSNLVIILIYLIATFAISFIIYAFFEKPITMLRDKTSK